MSDHNINLSFSHHPPLPVAFIISQISFLLLYETSSVGRFFSPVWTICLYQHYSVFSSLGLASKPPRSPVIRAYCSTIRQRSKDLAESPKLGLAILCLPILTASNFSDLQRSEKDLLGSSLNWGNGLWSAYWSPCCVCTLSLTELKSHKQLSKLRDTTLYRSSLQHASLDSDIPASPSEAELTTGATTKYV